MAVTTISSLIQPQNNGNSTAAVKTWGAAISSMFSGAGLTQTSDTGQVNWTTTTFTPRTTFGISTIGYEVWRFTDSLQSTKPIFLIVTYVASAFSSASTSHGYMICIQVCTATNGAGVATGGATTGSGVTSTIAVSNSNPTAQAVNGACVGYSGAATAFSSGDGSSIMLVIGTSAIASSTLNAFGLGTFYIDRTRDSSGAITAEGYALGVTGWNGNYNTTNTTGLVISFANSGLYSVYSYTLGSFLSLGNIGTANVGVVLPSTFYTSLSSGTTIGFDAPPTVVNQKVQPPVLAAIAYATTDTAANTSVVVPVNGANHTYMPLGSFCPLASRVAGATTVSLAVRYE